MPPAMGAVVMSARTVIVAINAPLRGRYGGERTPAPKETPPVGREAHTMVSH